MDTNSHIKEYKKNTNPPKEIISEAYHHRNIIMKKPFKKAFEEATNKLCMSEKGQMSLANGLFKVHCKKELEKEKEEFVINKNEFIAEKLNSDQFKELTKRYTKLKPFFDNNDQLGFYKALTVNELNDLGF